MDAVKKCFTIREYTIIPRNSIDFFGSELQSIIILDEPNLVLAEKQIFGPGLKMHSVD